ncbi:ATPase domain-containing protein [Deferrisoma camini]|uniref:ATPase domain-containing protein n=1 Tax=Deferrisoma camini TaxID=1035120 RepID=UPI00046CE365|nr:ATPase domain-containing protein [Deferrisoma camini]
MTRVPTHVPHLDAVIQGGFPTGSLVLVAGRAGTGKTLLALQWLFGNATEEAPGLYCTTLSEPQDRLLRNLEGYRFFDPGAVGGRVRFADLGPVLLERGAEAAADELERLLRAHEPAYLVVDSFRAIGDLAPSIQAYRPLVFRLGAHLATLPVTTLLLGEYGDREVMETVAASVVDGIVYLRNEVDPDRSGRRSLRVVKLRGSGFQEGEHPLWIDASGVRVAPRSSTPARPAAYEPLDRQVSTGVEGLDRLTGGGFLEGTATLFVGEPGAGKTTFCLHAVAAAARRGEPSLFVSFQEDPNQLARTARRLGVPSDGVEFFYTSPVELGSDRHVLDVARRAEACGARLVAVDSLTDLRAGAGDRYLAFAYSLVQHFKDRRVSLVLTLESSDLFGTVRISGVGISHVADNVVFLRYLEEDGRLGMALTVLKARGIEHSRDIVRYAVDSHGIRVLGRLEPGRRAFEGGGGG